MMLLVDDDVAFLHLAQTLLAEDDGLLETASARHAVDLVHAVDFSVALVDLDLPGQNGFGLIQSIHEARPKLPIIAISGVFSHATLESAKELGATAVLRKPITSEWTALISKVRLG